MKGLMSNNCVLFPPSQQLITRLDPPPSSPSPMSEDISFFAYIFDDSPECVHTPIALRQSSHLHPNISISYHSSRHKARAAKPYSLPKTTLKEIHDAVPRWCHEKKTFTSLFYVARTFFWGTVFYVRIQQL